MKTNRLDELSDGIFAIVMTILVFEIRVPDFWGPATNLELWSEIRQLFPVFMSYILSYAILFAYWRAHHFFISVYAKNIDSRLININAVFFMLISLVPFSANLLGKYTQNELAIAVFGIHMILTGLTLYWMRHYVLYSDHIQNPEITKREIHWSTVRTLVPVVTAIIAIPLSFFSTVASLTLYTLAVVFNLSHYSTIIFDRLLKEVK